MALGYSELRQLVTDNLPNNDEGLITPAKLRQVENEIINKQEASEEAMLVEISLKANSSDVYLSGQIDTLLNNKVDKVTGKGLSTNDYTDADKTKVGTIDNKVDKVTGKGLSTNDYTDYAKQTVDAINSTNVLDKHFTDDAFCVSRWETEVYAHQGFCFIPTAGANAGKYIYTFYFCNDGTYDANGNLINGTVEGDDKQVLRLSKVGLMDNRDRTFYDIAVQNTTYNLRLPDGTPNGTVSIPNFRPQGQEAFLLSNGYTIRLFGNALIYGKMQYFCRDFDTRTNTVGDVILLRAFTKHQTSWGLFTEDLLYDHFDWWVAGMPAAGVSYPSNALGVPIKDFMMCEIKRLFGGGLWAVVNIGSGSNDRAGSVLARSLDEGINWFIETAFNPLALPGTTGVNPKFLWEGVVGEDSNYYRVFLRGADSTTNSPATGLWRADVPKTNLKTYTIQKVLNETNQKVCMFSTYNKNILINPEFNKYYGPINSNRTVAGVYQLNSDLTTITRLFGISDANGCHTFMGSNIYKDTVYVVFSTSRRRMPQKRTGGDYYANTTEIYCKRFKADLLF